MKITAAEDYAGSFFDSRRGSILPGAEDFIEFRWSCEHQDEFEDDPCPCLFDLCRKLADDPIIALRVINDFPFQQFVG